LLIMLIAHKHGETPPYMIADPTPALTNHSAAGVLKSI
jgi:hypothetical protein